jgi:hypothetical protein
MAPFENASMTSAFRRRNESRVMDASDMVQDRWSEDTWKILGITRTLTLVVHEFEFEGTAQHTHTHTHTACLYCCLRFEFEIFVFVVNEIRLEILTPKFFFCVR